MSTPTEMLLALAASSLLLHGLDRLFARRETVIGPVTSLHIDGDHCRLGVRVADKTLHVSVRFDRINIGGCPVAPGDIVTLERRVGYLVATEWRLV